MKELMSVVAALTLLAAPLDTAWAQSDEADRIREAGIVLDEIMGAPDRGIPLAILERTEAIAVFPSTVKVGFIFGGQRGRGIISVLDREGATWSPPAFMTLTGATFGAQIGGQAADIVLLVMNRRGVERLLQNQFKLGGEASVVAGPVGRDAAAATDLHLRAEILSYSRSRGLFAGISLGGSAIRQDRGRTRASTASRTAPGRSCSTGWRAPRRRPTPSARGARRSCATSRRRAATTAARDKRSGRTARTRRRRRSD